MPSLFEGIEVSSATPQAKLALQFTILTCCRTTEVLHSTWNEIDLVKAIWVIPAERMKAGEMHSVPLSSAAVKVQKKPMRFEVRTSLSFQAQ